ncbi:formyltransferase family protein [Photorhabdus luminescens]|uniref:Formyl transferase n=1 Tax=Photorhabdus luminescens subsp. mexicana TaxID=2100167 RepID=A0A4V2X6Y9_PHOLU|nr:formyltransferase family protein [Photorhabdus luminescens]TDB53975.1 formyl transferase [Photorhabdus luminescens subsp. mexicana]
MNNPKTVVICGKGELAIFICQYFLNHKDYKVSHVVADKFEPVSTDQTLIDFCYQNNISVIEDNKVENLPGYENGDFTCDLCFVVFHKRILPLKFINSCKKILNIHLSYLPKYRGVRPVNWALKNGDQSHGVTIHEINEGIDSGPIVNQISFSIYPEFEEVIDTYTRAISYARQLFLDTMPILEKIAPRPQIDSEATIYYEKDNHSLEERMTFTKQASLELLNKA